MNAATHNETPEVIDAMAALLIAFDELEKPPAPEEPYRAVVARTPHGTRAFELLTIAFRCEACRERAMLFQLRIDTISDEIACPHCGTADRLEMVQ